VKPSPKPSTPNKVIPAKPTSKSPSGSPGNAPCSGSINPDTNLGGNLATVNEVFYGKKTSIIYNRVQN
jgi:hypothetical protein